MIPDGNPDLQLVLERDGLRFHVEHYVPREQARLALVMVHGFSAHCGLYRHVGAHFAGRGIAVTQFDGRGHGRSDGRRGHVDAFSDYLQDLAMVAAWARSRHPDCPWAVMGHSMGSAVALGYAVDEAQSRPDLLVLAAPWLKLRMKVSAPKQMAANLAARVLPTLAGPNGLKAKDISRNPEVQAGFRKDPLVHHVATAGWFMTMLRAQAHVRARAQALAVPTLMLLAGDDRIVANETNLQFAGAASSWVDVRTYEALYHELFLEPEAEGVLADIGNWLLDRGARTSEGTCGVTSA